MYLAWVHAPRRWRPWVGHESNDPKWAFTLAIKGPAINTNGLIYNLCKLHDKLEYHSFPTLFLFLSLIGGSITWYLHTHRANLLGKISVIIAASFYYAKT